MTAVKTQVLKYLLYLYFSTYLDNLNLTYIPIRFKGRESFGRVSRCWSLEDLQCGNLNDILSIFGRMEYWMSSKRL